MAAKTALSTNDTANILKEKGKNLFIAKKYDQAAAEYTKIIEEHNADDADGAPDGFINSILCNRAACYIALGHNHKALADLTEITSNPSTTPVSTLARTYFRLAQCHYNLGDYENAKTSMDTFDATLLTSHENNDMLSSSAVTALKRNINDKRSTTRVVGVTADGETELELITEGAFALANQRITYDVLIPASYTRSLYDFTLRFPNILAPTALLSSNPRHKPLRKFLAELAEKHRHTVLNTFAARLTCWKCGCPAKGLKHDPDVSRLSLCGEQPRVVDVVRPVCGTGDFCAHQPVGGRGQGMMNVNTMNRKEMKALARRIARRVKGRSDVVGYYGRDMGDMDVVVLAARLGVTV